MTEASLTAENTVSGWSTCWFWQPVAEVVGGIAAWLSKLAFTVRQPLQQLALFEHLEGS